MSSYLIEGGYKLKGKITISGNKNSVLPCLAASLLTDEEVTLTNVPNITDVNVFLEILESLGASVGISDHQLVVKCEKIKTTNLPEELVSKLRASILFAGPLLSREGKVKFFHPGGDVIGRRSIESHREALESLGFKFSQNDRVYQGTGKSQKGSLEIFLTEASVTATENLILASAVGQSDLVIKNSAKEPHVIDLCNLLVSMGAKIEGIGESTLRITGVRKLSGTVFQISSDPIEFGTYAIAAALTSGEIQIENIGTADLTPIIHFLSKMGVEFEQNGREVIVSARKIQCFNHLKTNIWPGFPTDMMSPIIVLATQAQGVSLCHDWMYESRMFFVDKLISMGAQITIADPHRVLVYGPTKLMGRSLESPDIRAGIALVLAALAAEGKSIINRAELIERGYEDVVEKLTSLGAKIQKIE